jgi:uncharacterized protein (DUF1015 family)
MSEIRPFRALRYDPAKLNLRDVVTQPYDKITPAMQQAYVDRHAANFIHFELPPAGPDPYSGARDFLAEARKSGFIRLEDRPAIYVYDQFFSDPADPARNCIRRALIVLGRLHDYSDGVIFRHEQTLTAPKRDREQLLKTTRVQSGLLFMLYDDPSQTAEELKPEGQVAEFVDDLGIRQRLWAVTGPAAIRNIEESIHSLPLFIADGHHRYETALSLRRSRDGSYPEDFAMMALVNMRSDGLIVLPTHRAIFGIEPEHFTQGIQRLRRELNARSIASDPAAIATALRAISADRFACVVAAGSESWLLEVDRALLQQRAGGRSCELDVEALHEILHEYFAITSEDAAAQRNIRYHRYAEEALKDVASGAQAAFLIRPVTVEKIRERSVRGALMPQKSTDFYPKMNSGLTLYSWDESFVVPQGAAR